MKKTNLEVAEDIWCAPSSQRLSPSETIQKILKAFAIKVNSPYRRPLPTRQRKPRKGVGMSGFIKKLEDTMIDSAIPGFFKRATGREYTERETCVNDIRRLLMCFWNDHYFARRAK